MGLIEADTVVTASLYDDEHEEFINKNMTIVEFLDSFTEEGCPQTVDVEPVRHGKWWRYPLSQVGFPDNIYMMRQCSQCKHAFDRKTNYCPNCGAKMDGKED